MKRKLIVVFMTIVMAVSLAFGMSIMTVGAADELTLGDVSTTYTSGTAIEISCSQFTTGGDEQELGGNSLTYVTVTSGGSTYNASNVRQIVSRKSLRVYFNGTGYSFSNAKKGDLFTVKQGMTSTKYPDLTVSEDINYIYTGISWIKGNEVPSNVEIIWPESFGTNDWGSMVTQLNLPTSSPIFNGGDLNPTAENLAKIRITRGETKFAASNVYGWNGKLTLYFNNTGYDGTNAQKDDVLTIDAGFTLTIDGTNYVSTKAKSYTFTGTQWVDTAEVPAEKTELTVSTLSLSSAQGKKDALLYLTTGSDNTADLGDANQSFCLNFVELNFADGTKGDVWYARICKNEVRFFVHNKNGSGNMNTTGLTRGDKFVVKTGFAYSATATSEVKADKNYIYDGSAWIEGTELPADQELTIGDIDPFYVSGTQVEMGCEMFTGADEAADLTVENGTNIVITDVDGNTYTPSNIRQVPSRKHFKLYFNGKGYSFDSAKRGDKLVIGEGFAIRGNYSYVVSSDITFFYTGTTWVKAETLPAEKSELKVGSITAGVGVSGAYAKDALIYVNTDSTNAADNGMNDVAELRRFVRYTFNGTPAVIGNVWFARLYKGEARFFVRQKTNGAANMAVSDIAKGDKFTVKKGFSIGNAEVKADVSYIFNGNVWVNAEDYIDYDKLTKNGIDTKEKELTLYKGDEFVLPELFYTYTTEVKVPETVDADDVTIENAPDMNTVNENGYQVTLKVGDFSVNITVKVLAPTDIHVTGVAADLNWNKLAVITDTANQKADTSAHTEYLRYFEYERNGVQLTISGYIIYGNRYEIDVKDTDGNWMVRDKVAYCKAGDKLTIKKGLPFLAGERLVETIAYVYNGNVWVNAEDYIDYDKLTKNGIDTKEKELTLYKGDEFVLPELFYTYTTEVKVPETVDADDVTIENAPDMNTVNENGYQVTLKVGDFSVNITVKVLAPTDIHVTGVAADLNWNKLAVITDTANQKADTSAHTEYLRYFEYERNGVQLTISGYIIYGNRYEIDVKDTDGNWMVRDKVAYCKVGDKFTVKKGLPFINGERLTETVTYVYNGTKFVKLVEPETFDVDATMSVFVNGVKQINVKDDAAVTAVYKYASSDDTVATVSETGVVKGIKVGTAKITVSYKDVSKEITVTVSEEPAKKGIEIVSDVEIFYVPVATATADNNFTSMGYTLLARYLYVDGSVGDVFDVEASQIGDINYTVAGLKDLTITIGEFTATVKVNVYEYKNVTSFTSLGVSGYDVNDDRNQAGTWNGHMIIGMNSISTSKGNMLSTESSEKMSEYIVYETAEGNKYYGKADKDNDIIDRIGVWQLGTNLLIMIKPEGSNANVGYGSEDHWKSDASYGYVPVYKAGDKITFLAGMPIYAWKGSLGENNYPAEGKGCLIVEGYVTEDIVYYCYEEDGVKSLWQIYKEYTDFTVNPSVTLTVGGTGSIGAVKTPIDATTGKFTYESSDPAVVTVTKDGNLAGLGIGTATVTVTLTGGKDADGNALDPIVKTVTVTVKKGIKSVSGEITVTKGATIDLADYEITVRYTDGTEENISLGANNVIVEDIDTSVTGTTEYGVRVTIDGETKRGTLTVTVKDAKKGCKGDVVSVSSILGLAFVTAGVIIVRKKSKKA